MAGGGAVAAGCAACGGRLNPLARAIGCAGAATGGRAVAKAFGKETSGSGRAAVGATAGVPTIGRVAWYAASKDEGGEAFDDEFEARGPDDALEARGADEARASAGGRCSATPMAVAGGDVCAPIHGGKAGGSTGEPSGDPNCGDPPTSPAAGAAA